MSLDTQPMDLDDLGGAPGALDEFRVSAPAEVKAFLKKLLDGNVPVYLNSSDGVNITTTLWTLDAAAGKLSFAADARDARLQALLAGDEIVAVAYLDAVKLQWDVSAAMVVNGGMSSALLSAFPRLLYRFQRRGSFRVRPLPRTTPLARLRPQGPGSGEVALRVLDVSIGGCALFFPDIGGSIACGTTISGATLELDVETRVAVSLRVHHVRSLGPEVQGSRLGCEFVKPGPDAERHLQRFIDQTQKKRRMFSFE